MRRTRAEIMLEKAELLGDAYSTARDRLKRTCAPIERYGHSNLMAYAFNIENSSVSPVDLMPMHDCIDHHILRMPGTCIMPPVSYMDAHK